MGGCRVISNQSHTKEWILSIREDSPGKDPILIEKMIMALTLLEHLKLSGMDFIFKGGTSLLLVLGSPKRFSIDIDILIPEPQKLESYFAKILQQGVFYNFEVSTRSGELPIPKKHFKFFYPSVILKKESHILLDVLVEKNPYPSLHPLDVQSSLVSMQGKNTKVICPSKECLLGDKLTAFAPHTTGIPYGKDKELEIAKQLFDVAVLFDTIEDVQLVRTTYSNIVYQELTYRSMSLLTSTDVLWDSINTSILIGMRGANSDREFIELGNGFRKLAGFVYAGSFTLDSAILCASKTAYLSALLLSKKNRIERFQKGIDISSNIIRNQEYNKINKLKKTNPEAFYYFFRALALLKLNEN